MIPRLRLAATIPIVLLALSSAPASAGGTTSHLVASTPWLTAPDPPPPGVPVSTRLPVATSGHDPASASWALPTTGFPVWPELLLAGMLLGAGTALRARARRGGIMRLGSALTGRR